MGTYVQVPADAGGKKVATKLDGNGNHVGYVTMLQASVSTASTVAVSLTVVTILPANPDRLSSRVLNGSKVSTMFIKEGAGATLDDYLYELQPGTSQELGPYTGLVTGIWDTADGDVPTAKARIAERT